MAITMKLLGVTYTYTIENRNGIAVKVQHKQLRLQCEQCNQVVTRAGNASIKSKSCGCKQNEWCVTHGMSGGSSSERKHPLYRIWTGMLNRCRNTKQECWSRYGGRGIKVCEQWKRFEPFRDWAMENGWHYKPKGDPSRLCIDRIDNDGDYTPDNCRFLTFTESNRHRSCCKINHDKAAMIKDLLSRGWDHKDIAQQMSVGLWIIGRISQKKSWQ
jgi:hypothetical protein